MYPAVILFILMLPFIFCFKLTNRGCSAIFISLVQSTVKPYRSYYHVSTSYKMKIFQEK